MRKLKPIYLVIGSFLIIFLLAIASWTILPRQGTIDIPGEGIYTGQLRGMTFHGYGKYESYVVSGTSYEGEWENGVYHGYGTLTFANGSQLVGDFNHGHLHGQGKSICPDGNVKIVDFGEQKHDDDCSGCGHHH